MAALLAPDTALNAAGATGLTLAGERVLDTHVDPLKLNCDQDDIELPVIAVYAADEDLLGSDDDKYNALCFDVSQLELIVELFVCARNGYELENVLDQFEEQVRFKLLPSPIFYPSAYIRGYKSQTQRSGEGRRLGMRRLTLTMQYAENVQPKPCPPNDKLRYEFKMKGKYYPNTEKSH